MGARRLVVVLVHLIGFSWLITKNALPSFALTIGKRGCQTECGNVSIPFPFGIGSTNNKCFLDDWFEIVCDNSTSSPTAYLKRTNLQVLNISLKDYSYYSSSPGVIQVKNPITLWNCTDKETRESLNLTGSPFVFSASENMFTAVSCGARALMSSSSLDDVEISAGCKSKCLQNKQGYMNCWKGVNCCQTTIPSYVIQTFSTTFETETQKTCIYAFVADQEWFISMFNHTNTSAALHNMDYVPVTLEWKLNNYSKNQIFGTNLSVFKLEDLLRSKSILCRGDYSISSENLTAALSVQGCYCNDGFEGNQYLLEGCQDINECQIYPHACDGGGTCVNTIGWYKCRKSKVKIVLIGFGSGVGALFLLIGAWFLYKFIKKRKAIKRRKQFFKRNGGLLLQQQISSEEVNFEAKTKLFSSKVLQKATDNFNLDRILGQGGQGTVYKGMLADGKIVAVKKSKVVDEDKLIEFINEVIILSQINHRNVVKLLGCCLETEVPLLVYEFIPNGTLSEYIHDQNEEFLFTWEMRLRIAAEIAGALSYLHSAASFPIYHRDIKSSNILLDEKLRAKVADFGTSKSVAIDQTHVTTMVHGTFGYLDPEYFQTSQFTDKSDVYSFGVVIVELLTGQKPICLKRLEEGRSLATYFLMCMEENRLFDIIDPQIVGGKKEEMLEVANLAKRCLYLNGRYRPTMKEVAMELEAIQKSIKTVAHRKSNEEVEYERTEITEPWDVSTTIGPNSSTSIDVASSLDESPLLSK
ncbi:wall-associated receptor kinase-like 3 [Ziziphus jujuba]|uniref:Wall-associated receptor kinase-like 3 n=1 Tax=Ziziphus jujuba TaxID=326968 RepID=A0ABM4A5T9_ZIZJJ|nr:wall-associated receptor kinase-like 3 [Ziziphus jujuba]